MASTPPQNKPRMSPADKVAIIALLVSIISLGITSYLSYFSIQTQKEIANLQATAQVQDIHLQQDLQNNSSFAHLELTNLIDGFRITNHGPGCHSESWLSVITWAKLMQNEPRLDAGADQTRLVRRLGV